MTIPNIGVLAIQGDVQEHARHLERSGAKVTLVKGAAELKTVEGLIIPGGESTTMSILAVRNHLLEPLREFSKIHPVYGSCAGLIMLADQVEDGRPDQQTLGGLHITAKRNAFGRQVDSFEIDLAVPALGPAPFHAVFIRAPLVTHAKDDVEVLSVIPARHSLTGQDQIVAVRQGNLLATSFHPEITSDLRFHQYFVEMVKMS